MQQILRKYWFKMSVVMAILVPAAMTQTIYPIFALNRWELLADRIYASLLGNQLANSNGDSKVIIVEVDQATIDKFGWPISRSYYSDLYKKLKLNGHPYVLSLLSLQSLSKFSSFAEAEFKKLDENLAATIKDYDRVVGASLLEKEGAELTGWQEDELMPRISLSSNQTPPEELPYLPMHFIEDDMFLEAQLASGFSTRRGDVEVAYCSQMYITDGAYSGSFVIPSSLVWVASYASGRSFMTQTGAGWPRLNEEAPVSETNPIKVGYRHCVSAPQMLTHDFLAERGILRISMSDIVDGTNTQDFTGKIVVLGYENATGFVGPGNSSTTDNNVKDYQFSARLIDDMIAGKSIRRENLSRYELFDRLPVISAAVLILISFLGVSQILILASVLLFGATVGWSFFQLNQGVFLIPVQLIVFSASVTTLLIGLELYLRFYGITREIRFSAKVRRELSMCNTIFDIEKIAQKICTAEFMVAKFVLGGFDRGLYKAAENPKKALQYLDSISEDPAYLNPNREDTNIRKMPPKSAIQNLFKQRKNFKINLVITVKDKSLGHADIDLLFMPHEERFVTNMMDSLRLELGQHWGRIKLLVDQKLSDYRMLMEQTRSDILARFLTKSLVSRFSNKKTMEENLLQVLTPKPTRAALMQADIRGYSRVSARLAPKDMVQLLQNYYKNVVDAAQQVAQVKLIGDCIFLFIEESSGLPDTSPVDMCVELASILVSETNKQNRLREDAGEEPMYFGVAIHYGEVVVGNLSSDSCIDYTVIGPNVNMVARLEEMTKHPNIGAVTGVNGTIISEQAMAAMKKHSLYHSAKLDLIKIGVSVRSFADVTSVYGVTSDQILMISPDSFKKLQAAG